MGRVEVKPGKVEDTLLGDPPAQCPALGFGPPVHPDDRRSQVTALRVFGDHAVDLTGQTERSDVAGRHPASLEQGGYDGPERRSQSSGSCSAHPGCGNESS